MEEKKYIYSIIRNPQETQDSSAFRFSAGILGLNNRNIAPIFYKDIAAVVSNTHLINFDKLDKKELTHLVAMHEQVNSDLMKKHNVIPMRFGMIAESSEEIRSILTKAYIQFKIALKRIAGKAEFVVQVFWSEKNILEKIVKGNVAIQKLKKSAESKGKILGFSSKMKLGKAIFEAIEATRKEYTADILGHLATYFPDFSAGKLLNKEMLMNYSFLIGKTEESALEFQLNKLAEKYKDKLKFKYIGPMAPYSFTAINFSLGNYELVDQARQTLGLGTTATLSEIKDVYYKLAAQYHPDKYEYKKEQHLLEEARGKMQEIIGAKDVLKTYCRHYSSAFRKPLCSFKKEDVEEVVIIKGG